MTRLTFSGINLTPEWHPDGQHFAFVSDRHKGMPGLYWMRADGAEETVRLTDNKNIQFPYSFSPDGKRLAYVEADPQTGSDIWILPLEGTTLISRNRGNRSRSCIRRSLKSLRPSLPMGNGWLFSPTNRAEWKSTSGPSPALAASGRFRAVEGVRRSGPGIGKSCFI